MPTITVKTATASYPVVVEQNCLQQQKKTIEGLLANYSHVLVITDQHVSILYKEVCDWLQNSSNSVLPFVTPNGESAKTFAIYEAAMTHMISHNLDRKSVIVALGGGAVGDLAGFVAASYMRGIDFIQLPTTVLAHDSAVGGKTAINHPLAKNIVGAFHQPQAVYYDTSLLASLPERQMRSGFAELIKHGLIADATLLAEVMANYQNCASLYARDMTPFLTKGIQIKADIVAEDEREQGIRAYLNFGHTFGHAVEAAGDFKHWFHGEAIMIGMKFALLLSQQLTGLQFDVTRWQHWAEKLGYDFSLPPTLTFEQLYDKMMHDKKTTYQAIHFVLLNAVGQPISQVVTKTQLAEAFEAMH
ncbi:3-dehydroquinate synthase [Brochothrix campestris]|uniref:3-dehydroquinate synthase n=1 Tax=Brochothrix campestris TaxID=2757 RepID=UPI0038D1CA3E